MERLLFKCLAVGMLVFLSCLHPQAQESGDSARLAMAETGPYSLVERSDWRQYDISNGKRNYKGLVSREVRAFITPNIEDNPQNASKGSLLYKGNFFVLENTRREVLQSAQAVNEVVPVSFRIRENGAINIMEQDRGFPSLRGFPTFPTQRVRPGFTWTEPGSRAIDPFNSGESILIPFTARYEYKKIELYKNIPVHRIYAEYSTRYQSNAKTASEQSVVKVDGNHRVDIFIQVSDGLLLFMRDTLDETYVLANNTTIKFEGFTLTYGQGSVPLDREALMTSLENTLNVEILPEPFVPEESPEPEPEKQIVAAAPPPQEPAPPSIAPIGLQGSDIDLVPVSEGIRLTIKDIRFAPDSANFLPAEKPRLDLLAQALNQIPDRTFLVEGHTAITNNDTSGDMELSIARAKRMIDELVSRGISAERFIYKGWGGTKPLDTNDTTAGRSRNRRVEITILE